MAESHLDGWLAAKIKNLRLECIGLKASISSDQRKHMKELVTKSFDEAESTGRGRRTTHQKKRKKEGKKGFPAFFLTLFFSHCTVQRKGTISIGFALHDTKTP